MLYLIYWYLTMSALTSLAFFTDKKLAEARSRRVPERWLHSLELLGGWPGALLSSEFFRHKRQKGSYMFVLYGIAALHGVTWLMIYLKK